ncbi:hypothetical protein ACJ8BA_00145 [Klebsiella pneumoniae]
MFIDSEKRLKQLSDEAKKNTEDLEEAKKNSRFTQVSPKGWERVRELLKDSQGISALRLCSFLAEHIDPTCGAVVADQPVYKLKNLELAEAQLFVGSIT